MEVLVGIIYCEGQQLSSLKFSLLMICEGVTGDLCLVSFFFFYFLVRSVCFIIILSFVFQAGAKHVYAVEASEMAKYARKLVAGNPILGQRITVRIFS